MNFKSFLLLHGFWLNVKNITKEYINLTIMIYRKNSKLIKIIQL